MKYMNLKRFGAAAMTGALALSLAAPAFAADEGDDASSTNTSITITGSYQATDLAVTVPQVGSAIINPYGLPVELKSSADEGAEADATISGEQITTASALTIDNRSAVALAVSAEVVGEVANGSDAVLIADASAVDTADSDGNVAKNIAAKFEAFAAPGVAGDPASDWDLAEMNVAFAALKSENAALTAPVLAATDEVESTATKGTLVLREGDDEHLPQDGSVAFIRLSGNVAKKPTTAWADDDGFDAKIAFTFEPSEYVGTVELSAVESVAVGGTAKINVTLPEGVTYAEYDTIKWTSSKTANVTVVDGTRKPTTGNNVDTITGTVTGVKTGSTKSVITVEFVGSNGVTYRGTTEVKCG